MRMWVEHRDDRRRYTFEITGTDLLRAKFDNWDQLLFRDVEQALASGSSETPIADALLALQAQALRIEQARVRA